MSTVDRSSFFEKWFVHGRARAKEPQLMMNRLEDLWMSADDGASAPIGPLEIRAESEFDDLLDAWYVERRNSIECEILLERAKNLIVRLLSESPVCPSKRKQARQLIHAIDQALRMVNTSND
jgi:hypothetical protein